MSELSRDAAVERALATVEARLERPGPAASAVAAAGRLDAVGRLTVAFHPDRLDRRGLTAADGLLTDGAYLSQWVTGASSGSRSAVAGGQRARWERAQFGVDRDIAPAHRPVYGALDLLHHRHGGSPAFGSCFLVLDDAVRDRCTMSVGDTHLGPERVGTFRRPGAVVDGLVEQARAGTLLGQRLDAHDLDAVLAGERRPAPTRTLDDYVEVQVHGGVGLTDVAAVAVDPCYRDHPVAETLRRVAEAAGVTFWFHAGTVVAPDELVLRPDDVAAVDEQAYVDALRDELREAAAPADLATAATIGRILSGRRPGPVRPGGDGPRSPLQRVKHLWRLTYLLGRDAPPREA